MSLDCILPVVDLKRGQVVHGIAGERASYGPIVSKLVGSPHPAKVATAVCGFVGVNDLYLADLDAIAGDEPDWNAYDAIGTSSLQIWLDAGVGTANRLRRVLARCKGTVSRVIVALESLPSLRALEELVSEFPDESLVFSLDLKNALPVTTDPAAARLSAETIASFAVDAGIRSMIVLDVAAVGGDGMATVDLCRKIKSRHLDLELLSGGGVQSLADVQRLVEAGCDRVLVASALHSGAINL